MENSSSLTIGASSTSRRESEAKYKGVRKRKWGRWVSEIRLPNSRSRIWLGSYDAPEKAARAFDVASAYLRRGRAQLNFPDSLPSIPYSCSLTTQQIQDIAARYANAELPPPVAESELSELELPGLSCDGEMDWSFMDVRVSEDRTGFGFASMDEFYYDFSPRPGTMGEVPEQYEENGSGVFPTVNSFLWNA